MKRIIILFTFIAVVFNCLSTLASDSKTVVYYFWKKPRCVSCVNIENYTREVIQESFSQELKDGTIEYKIIDFSLAKNKYFGKQYGLYTKSVILSKIKDGKEIEYKNLDKIWLKLGNKKDFKNYVEEEIKNF